MSVWVIPSIELDRPGSSPRAPSRVIYLNPPSDPSSLKLAATAQPRRWACAVPRSTWVVTDFAAS
jgi:hypothetical protein